MNIIKEIRDFVESECSKPTSKYGYEPFKYHCIPTVKYGGKLADELGGDKEVVLIACWLHDIGSIVYGRKDHHITGAKIAEKKLKELKYPQEKIELVTKCILNHRGSQKNNAQSVEEKIVSDADALSNFENIPGIFKAAFVYENNTQGEAKESVRRKLQNKWNQLHFQKSKKLIRSKFKAAMIILG